MNLLLSADHIIPSAHLHFAKLASTAWAKFCPEIKKYIVIVSNCNPRYLYKEYGDYFNDIFILPIDKNIHRRPLATMARLYAAAMCFDDDELVTLEDIDLIPLQREWHIKKLNNALSYSIMLMGPELCNGKDHLAPMSKATAPAWLWKKIINPYGLDWCDFLKLYYGNTNRSPENALSLLNPAYFNDEKLLAHKINNTSGVAVNYIERGYRMETDTVDRACWNLLDVDKLRRGGYIECHALKPYDENLLYCANHWAEWGMIDGLWPIIRYVGYDEPKIRCVR